MAFLEVYKKEVNLPFICLIRADSTDERLTAALKEARCVKVYFGLNPEMKNCATTYAKNVTDEMIIRTAGWLKNIKSGLGHII